MFSHEPLEARLVAVVSLPAGEVPDVAAILGVRLVEGGTVPAPQMRPKPRAGLVRETAPLRDTPERAPPLAAGGIPY
jgi:hypothetical protein